MAILTYIMYSWQMLGYIFSFVMASRKKSCHHLDLRIDNQDIGVTQTSKFLGVYIDDKLNWKAHISHVAWKLRGELEF